ncbi:MAG: Fe-S cluster assembly protein SufD [Gemmatimonadetes bacterium]|jgi:Fe-S cluster assembly protein SufD|nr:Fe-S cluster assembly protein SufD [Gemmatimonadota bacterium]
MSGTDWYQSRFADFEQNLNGEAQGPVHQLRRDAIAHFTATGFPTSRDEEWRFTNIAPLTRIDFELAAKTDEPATADIAPLRYGLPGPVFVDGHFAPSLSQLDALPQGVVVKNLRTAFIEDADLVCRYIGQDAMSEDQAFTALNTAFVQDGVLIYLPQGTVLDTPLHTLFLSTGTKANVVSHPRVLVVAEAHAEATLVESYGGLGVEVYLTNSVCEINVGENASIDHYRVQREAPTAFHISATHVREARSARFRSTSITLGGSLTRNHVHTALMGEGIDSTLNGLYIENGSQHVDNHTLIEHAQPNCQSHEFYKGVLDDEASGVFRGKIHVHQAAQKTDAYQANQNLLLSDSAKIDTKPQLEIYADDVKCSHGATIGQLDADAIFYLRSRGIGHREAVRVLTRAFAGEVLDRVRIDGLRDELDRLVTERLDRAAGVAP